MAVRLPTLPLARQGARTSRSVPAALAAHVLSAWLTRVRSLARLEPAERVCRAGLAISILLYVFFLLRLSWHLLDGFALRTFDLGIFDQATWLISRGASPFVTVRGMHLLAEHFSAILYLLAPLYWLWPSPKALLTVQTVALALGAIPVYALARRRLDSAPLALAFGVAYLLYPALEWSNSFEFHPDTLATPCLLGAFYCLSQRRWRPYTVLLVLAALTKETVGLTVIALGLYALRTDRCAGWLTVGGGLLALAVSLGTVSWLNRGQPSLFYWLYHQYGDSPGAILAHVVRHPWAVAADLNTEANREYLFLLLYPVVFLALLAPEVLLLAAPALLVHLLSSSVIMHTIYFQYTALVTPFVFAAAIVGADRCRRWADADRWMRPVLAASLCVGMVAGLAHRPFTGHDASVPPVLSPAQAAETRRILALIPAGASVSTQVALIPHLAHRREVYIFPNPFQEAMWGYSARAMEQMGSQGFDAPSAARMRQDANKSDVAYVALCAPATSYPLPARLYFDHAVPLLESPAYGIVALGADTLLLRRGADHAGGLRLLARRSGVPIARDQDIRRAFLAWVAGRSVGPKI